MNEDGAPPVSDAHVVWLDDVERASPEVLGGKLSNLAEITRRGFAVPPAFGVTTLAYRRFLTAGGLEAAAAETSSVDPGDLEAVQAASARMVAAILEAELPADVEAAIRGAYARFEDVAGEEQVPVAVRSSAVAEDLAGASFAGQYETFLWITGAEEVLQHVRKCWTGPFTVPALTYRHEDAPAVAPEMAVGVQLMVTARAAGVMFTLDPLNGDRSKVVIEGAWGLGESVVGGEVNPDRHRVDKVTLELLGQDIASKDVETRFDASSGRVQTVPVPEDRRLESCLEPDQVIALARLAKRIEADRDGPVDIEWAIDGRGRVHVLQVRPETVWSRKPRASLGASRGGGVNRVLATLMARTAHTPAAGEQDRE